MVDPKDLGNAIQRLRGDRTQRVCADRAGISASSWSLYESGARNPRKSMRERISYGLGLNLQVLEDAAWQVRSERLAAAGERKTAEAGGEAAGDPLLHAIDEHVNGVAYHLRELALLMLYLRASQKPPLPS
jgi:transcriptional regulator with XRE-family HTH domain